MEPQMYSVVQLHCMTSQTQIWRPFWIDNFLNTRPISAIMSLPEAFFFWGSISAEDMFNSLSGARNRIGSVLITLPGARGGVWCKGLLGRRRVSNADGLEGAVQHRHSFQMSETDKTLEGVMLTFTTSKENLAIMRVRLWASLEWHNGVIFLSIIACYGNSEKYSIFFYFFFLIPVAI